MLRKGMALQVSAFLVWATLSYFAVGYAVDHSIMGAGRAAMVSLIGFFVLQLGLLKMLGNK